MKSNRRNGNGRHLSRSKRFFNRTLAKMASLLWENGYCGYINLNTVVNEEGNLAAPSPGGSLSRLRHLDPLQKTSWADLLPLDAHTLDDIFDTQVRGLRLASRHDTALSLFPPHSPAGRPAGLDRRRSLAGRVGMCMTVRCVCRTACW